MLCLDRSAIILAVESSSKFDSDKGTLELNGKPLISYVVDAVKELSDEIIIVTGSQQQGDAYAKLVSSEVRFVVDTSSSKSALSGAQVGFEAANGEYSALLPFDSPFISQEVLSLLFDCAVGKEANIPRYTNQEMEPLHAVYHTKEALKAAKEALAENQFEVEAMVEQLRGVRFMSTMVLEQLDPDLKTFFTVKTPLDLKKAAVMFKPRKTSKTKDNIKGKR
jgi:molybdopterin-guanine dinucleotide biosynthesis protein A